MQKIPGRLPWQSFAASIRHFMLHVMGVMADFSLSFCLSGVEVSRTRCTIKANLNMQENVVNSLLELEEFCQPLYRIPKVLSVFTDLMQTDESGEITVPFSCHYFLR